MYLLLAFLLSNLGMFATAYTWQEWLWYGLVTIPYIIVDVALVIVMLIAKYYLW